MYDAEEVIPMNKAFAAFACLAILSGCSGKDEYYAIDHFYIPEEGDAFREAFNQLTVDTYNWYASIEGEEGVYIVHYDFYTKELMKEWADHGIYQSVPSGDLSYLVCSPNYLEDSGIDLSDEDKDRIIRGVRVYLLPESLSEEEREAVTAFLSEEAVYGLGGPELIPTTFSRNPRMEFRTYRFDGTLDTLSDGEIRDPVIYIASTANMWYFESESLIATGVKDSYIKLTAEAYRQYAGSSLPKELKERKVTFKGLSRIGN